MGKRFEQILQQKSMAHNQVNRFSTSLDITKMHIKYIIICHYYLNGYNLKTLMIPVIGRDMEK